MKTRNADRDMLIYHARKDEGRTFADIGREYGISPNRVRAIYRKLDWQLNGLDADHHKNDPSFPPAGFAVVKDQRAGKYVVTLEKHQ